MITAITTNLTRAVRAVSQSASTPATTSGIYDIILLLG